MALSPLSHAYAVFLSRLRASIPILVALFVTLLGAIDPPTSRDGATADAAEPVGFIVANNLFRSSSRE